MTLLERLQDEMKTAMKVKNADRLQVLRLVIAEIKNEAFKEGKKRDEIDVLMAFHKKLIKARDEYGSHQESYKEKLNFEISVVDTFMPKFLTEDEIISEIRQIQTPIDMKTVMPIFKGRADPKLVQEIVKGWGSTYGV